jgi:hypothetical protein
VICKCSSRGHCVPHAAAEIRNFRVRAFDRPPVPVSTSAIVGNSDLVGMTVVTYRVGCIDNRKANVVRARGAGRCRLGQTRLSRDCRSHVRNKVLGSMSQRRG